MKNHEGYPDPTANEAINGVRKEEKQRLLEKKHGFKRGEKVTLQEENRNQSAPNNEILSRDLSHGNTGRKNFFRGIKRVGTAVPRTIKRSC